MATIQDLYGHLRTLTKQWFYDKSEIDTALNEKADAGDLHAIATSGSYNDLENVPDTFTPSAHEHAATEVKDATAHTNIGSAANATQATINSGIDSALSTKANSADLADVATSGSYNDLENVPSKFTPSAHEHAASEVKDATAHSNIGSAANATQSTINSSIDTALGTKANSTDLADVATSGDYGDLENIPETFTPAAHTQASSTITDANTYSNIGNATSTQESINSAIDTKLGALLSIELIEVAATLPTASASTKNKFYCVPESTAATNDKYEIFVTIEDNGSYEWEKVDTARIDLSGKADIDHVHGNITNDGKIGSTADQFVTTTTGGLVTSQATIGNITTSGAIGSDNGKVVVTTTNGVLTTSDWVTEVDTVIQSLIAEGNNNS